jgi:methylglutaconyl-CoA hydratase
VSADRVAVSLDQGVLSLTLNRPAKRNAIDSAMVSALLELLERAELDAAVRVVVLRGAGPDFCAGADLDELLETLDQPLSEHETQARRLGEVFLRIRRLPKPVVAAVHGRALAGGCGLATACDLAVARDDAQFGYPEIKRGFVPAMVMAILRRAVGEKVAFDLVSTGRTLSAAEAHRLGLVARVASTATFEREVSEVLDALARASASALALVKQQLYQLDGLAFEDAIALGAQVNAVARTTPEFREGVARFLKRP